ncbi:two component transcriptional regulator, AraC family [Lacrimispora sphenoides]|jgi:two-component system response regulator YesN|uniref:response regulator transcription factor n=1 Tax=Lacrimispora sphenoides TaxID=29370 RepID=UPI0008C45CEF|nr:helix-turn-helix domain-containing protein [Lacrimispora sphenoides]SEU32099.1 two component transcriptional regulator, AraC family [Lacrimispora sphenoides]
MGYKVLVADDEYIIRRGIISFLRQYSDFELAAEAEDGVMALELAKDISPDVYFVDINMPFLNGLQFIKSLKEINPRAVAVIITGYDRFEYAREALKLGVFEYLLKPLMEGPFDEMMQRVRERLQREASEDKYLDWAKSMLAQNRTYLASNFLQRALEGHYTREEIMERSQYLNLLLPEPFTITVVSLEYQKMEDVKSTWNEDLLFFVAENIANEMFQGLVNPNSCQDRHGNLVVISKKVAQEIAEEQSETYCKMLESRLPVRSVVIQGNGDDYGALAETYETAVSRLKELETGSSVIKDVKFYIEDNFSREDFSFQDAADHVNLSVPHLSRMFRKEMGVTFIDYLTSVRIRKAIELLHNGELKIYEIAELTGYANQHYFSNVFKKNLGVSPAEYRRLIRNDNHASTMQ